MTLISMHRLRKLMRNSPSLLKGFNIYTDPDKLRLIDMAFGEVFPSARSFADLGGVWKVNGAYTRHALRHRSVRNGVLVDTDIPRDVHAKLSRLPSLRIIRGDFGTDEVVADVGKVDVAFFFDVLLHQANPDWDTILAKYARTVSCFVIFNQQYVRADAVTRLTDLPLEEYLSIAPRDRETVYRHVWQHRDDMHPTYGKPWKDIHNIFQWGITDPGLWNVMKKLGFKEAFFHNYGRFSNLPAFENHGFIFVKSS